MCVCVETADPTSVLSPFQTKEQRVSEVQVQMRQLSADGEKQVTLDQSGNAASLFGHGRLEPWPREQYPPFFPKKSG